MRWSIPLAIFRRDLLEALRDRRTLMLLVVVPLLLYPLLMVGGALFTGALKRQLQDKPLKLAVWGAAPAWLLAEVEREQPVEWVDRREALPAQPAREARALLEERKAHAVLALSPEPTAGAEDNLGLELYFDRYRPESAKAYDRLEPVFAQARVHLVRDRFEQAGMSPALAEPLQVKESDFRSVGVWYAATLIYMLVFALMLSGFYPAIDVTAGEKERGTLQTLLCAPVRPLEVVLGKYGVVVVFSLSGALMNLVGLGLAAVALGGLGGALEGIQVNAQVLLLAFCTLVPLALLVSALLISVAVLARSFKEAQNYLTPLLMVLIAACMGAMIPGVELTPTLALVPVLNVALVLNQLLTATVSASLLSLVFISTLAWAVGALLFAARVFESEQVLLSGEKPWRDVFGRRAGRGDRLSPGSALLFFAVIMTVSLYAGTLLRERLPLWACLVILQVGVLLVPAVLWVKRSGADPREGLSLRLPSRRGALALLLLAPAVLGAQGLLKKALEHTSFLDAEEFAHIMGTLMQQSASWPLPLALALLALAPALCEEAAFRGVILTGLSRTGSRVIAVVGSALMFGLLHVHPAHVFIAAVLGLLFSHATLQTRSILAGVLLHFTNNAAATLAARVSPEQLAWTDSWLLSLALCVPGGVALWLLRSASADATSAQAPRELPAPLAAAVLPKAS
jgi:sodium transport system permease protein